MTRRRFYSPPEAFFSDPKSARLGLEETRHLRNVLRLRAGDEVFLFDGDGREYQGEIATIDRESAEVKIIAEVEPASPESSLNFTLAVALLKNEKFDLVTQKATELGVTNFIPLLTSRADVRLKSDEDAERKVNRWQRIALEATKQCGRARLMKIEKPMDFANLIHAPNEEASDWSTTVSVAKPASEDACVPVEVRCAPVDEVRLMFAERQGGSLAEALNDLQNQMKTVTALVGPEGGWEDHEIDQARAAGWRIVTLGGRTLRAETAAIAIAALIQHCFSDLK